ncbi:MAG: DEAD/DEAH box helicase [Coriobacteriales bacterium]|nr:DEAD/DEAH box helicase [Coriobacteriales bacterium]
MIEESALRRACTAATFAHARRVAEEGSRLHRRRLGRDGSDISLRASVESHDSWEAPHNVYVTLDEDTGALVDYGCDCVTSVRKPGPCRHAIALALDYLLRPHLYEGANAEDGMATSRSLARLIERGMAPAPATDVAVTEPAAGTVDLALTLAYEVGFGARFRITGSKGSYALSSISEFATHVEERSLHAYGKNLAFVHDPAAFCPRAKAVADVLVRAIRNRRAYSYERVTGRGAFGAPALPARELHLSPPELEDLLACYVDATVGFEWTSAKGDAESRALLVRREDPVVALSVAGAKGGAFRLDRTSDLHVVSSAGRAYAWDDRYLYVCGDELSAHADLLAAVFGAAAGPLVVASRDARAFCATVLPSLEEVAAVAVPAELEALRPVPCELQFYVDRSGGAVSCVAFAVYGEERCSIFPARRTQPADGGMVRDVAAETRAREVCRRLFPQVGDDGSMVSRASGEALARLVFDGVRELQRLGTVYTTPAFDSLRSKARPSVRVGLSVRSRLLDVSFYAEGIDSAELAGLLESYRLKRRFHRLQDGSFVELAHVDASQAGMVARELGLTSTQVQQGHVTLPAYHALPLEPLLAQSDVDGSVGSYLQRIRDVDLAQYEVPESLAGVLRPYQADGYRWLCGLADLGLGGILADEMGLGKSVQLISLLLARQDEARAIGPSLVVCPASLVFNWLAEFGKFAPQLDVRAVTGTAQERTEVLAQGAVDVLVTSYDLLKRDREAYASHDFWCVVLDEAQYVKNHETQAAQAVKELRCQHRIALSGTPVENRLSELWSIFDFLMPGLLGPYERFRQRFEKPIVEGDQECSERLSSAIGPFVLRRTKRDVVRDLPGKVERTVRVRMGKDQRNVYDAQVLELRGQLLADTDSASSTNRIQILAGLTRLRQICCDPALVFEDYQEGSAKTEALLTLLGRLADSGQKTLVFSQFTSYLDTISARLRDLGVPYYEITGATPKQRRVELVDRFNEDATPVFLISLKAGGTGLNLTGASAVVHADPWWNVAAQNQATDRAHRIGQTKNVTVYRLICSDSIEERIVELQRAKARLAHVVTGGAAGMSLASLSREDLEALLQ